MSAPQIGDRITTAQERDSAPVGIVVWSAEGTLAARYNDQYGVVLGDERTFHWRVLALPLTVLYLRGQLPRPERVIKAEALQEAAAELQVGAWADGPFLGRDRAAAVLGMAQRATNYLRVRADRIERGEP